MANSGNSSLKNGLVGAHLTPHHPHPYTSLTLVRVYVGVCWCMAVMAAMAAMAVMAVMAAMVVLMVMVIWWCMGMYIAFKTTIAGGFLHARKNSSFC